MAQRKGKNAALLKPGMLTLAVVALWSARHEPDSFDTASVGTWLLGALAVGLTMRAALALFTPALALCTAILGQAYQSLQDRIES
jgi:hypothetical protein